MLNIITNNKAKMTSKDIAELINNRHDVVKKSIERLCTPKLDNYGQLKSAVISQPPMADGHKSANGVIERVYVFTGDTGIRDSIIVVAQLSPEFTARLVDRWRELETQSQFKIPETLSEALRLSADLAEQVEQQLLLIEQQQPAVEFVERFVEAKSAKSMREVAKVLGVKEKDFISRLINEKILFRQSGSILPFASYQHKGYFTVKTGEANGHAYQQTRFTPLGINWISKRFGLIE